MKAIRLSLLIAAMVLAAGLTTSCTDYQDEIDALEYRVTVLENLVKRVNSDITSIQTILDAMEGGDYITNVTNTDDGYIITFANEGAIVITDGKDGERGERGRDAQAPNVSVQQDSDGLWYWVLNGEWLVVNGQKIRANGIDGRDGKDGVDGQDGKDGVDGEDGKDGIDGVDGKDGRDGVDGKDGKAISPQLRINQESGVWEISTDGGETWISTGTPATGKDGKDGQDADSLIESVNVTTSVDGDVVVFKLRNGVTFTVPLLNNHS
jgi:hypothetical protein